MSSTLPGKLTRDPFLRVGPVVRPGTRIGGRYRVESAVGRGGMGLVVSARDERTGARVAVKVLLPHMGDSPTFARRALREARAAGALTSEHAVRVLDAGQLDSGLPYMVMELLEGTDFERLLAVRGTLSVPEVATCLVQACDAIVEAHARGIVHRDLKPSNLFLTHRNDGTPLVKLMDFGISKLLDAEGDGALTPTPDSPGTPRYMSPEQLLSARLVDSRTDVWALGVIAFRMLAGRYPFDGETAAAVHIAIASTPAPSLGDPRLSLPAPIVEVVERCLTKSLDDRLQTARAFAAALFPFADTRTRRRCRHLRDPGPATAAVVAPRAASGRERRRGEPGEPIGQILRVFARKRRDRNTAGLLATLAHVAVLLWAAGWPANFPPKAWAGAELTVLPREDVTSASTEFVLDPGPFGSGEPGEIGSGAAPAGGRAAGVPSVKAKASAAKAAHEDALEDPFMDWLWRSYGAESPGAALTGPRIPGAAWVGDPSPAATTGEGGLSESTSDEGGRLGNSLGNQPPPQGLARPASLLPNWDCEYPGTATHDGIVRLIATVGPDGVAEEVGILSDPGNGFAEVARQCAIRQPFVPALDERGRRIRSKTRPFIVRFIR